MNSLTKFFLILLRIAIGWHLLFAGLAKFQPDYKGSEGYLQESAGPVAPLYHSMIGDRLADKLAYDSDPAKEMHDRFPPALNAEWNDYFEAFAAHYNLTAEQRENAQKKIDKMKDKAVNWMANEEVTVKKPSDYGPPAENTKSVADWVKDYQARRKKISEEAAGDYHFLFSPASLTDNTQNRSAEKAEVSRIRAELTKKLDGFKNDMKQDLRSLLTEEQTRQPLLAEPVKPTWRNMTRMDWIDFQVRWGLTIVGVCLILGFFTRLNCVGGALLLLSFYLAVPPLPGLPELFRAEGYPYINKNIVEMLALLTLATTRSGRWAGLDGLLYYLNPFRRKMPEPRQVVPGQIETFTPYQVTASDGSRAPLHSQSKL